jgi:predicted amidohydrolase YtcJ
LLLVLAACGGDQAEWVFSGGTVHLDVERTTDAFAVTGGVIVATGQEALDRVGKQTEAVDLAGSHVLAGMQDAHVHLLAGSFAFDRLLLLGTPSMSAMADAVADYAAENPSEPWIVGYGWLGELIDDPSGAEIDAVLPDRPVLLISSSGHAAIVNQKALELAGITAATPDPAGGTIARDPETGEPTGYLLEAAISLVSEVVIAEYDDATLSSGLVGRIDAFVSGGLTGVSEILAVPGIDLGRPQIYADLEASGELDMRVTYYMPIFAPEDVDVAESVRGMYDGDLVRFGGGKIWVDGSMGTVEAWITEPYNEQDEQGNWVPTDSYGSHYFEPEVLAGIVSDADQRGIPLKFHANGDAAVDAALDALEAASSANGGLSQQNVIEHAVLLSDVDRSRIVALGLVASVQPTHYLASSLGDTAAALGDARFANAYDFRAFEDAGIPVALGTDWPVWPNPEPLLTSWSAATTNPDNGLTVQEALRGYTEGSAQAIGRGDELGRLDVGYLADFVVLGGDPLGGTTDDLVDLPIEQVWVAGRQVR